MAAIAAYVAAWILMSTAMMPPTATRLPQDFAATVRQRPERQRLELTTSAGCVGTWMVTDYVFRIGDISVHAAVDAWSWLGKHTQVIEGGTLLAAGLFQFSRLKHRFLVACRTPRSFIFRHWSGRQSAVDTTSAWPAACRVSDAAAPGAKQSSRRALTARPAWSLSDKRSDAAQSGSRVRPLSPLLVEHCERRDRNGYLCAGGL
jgi:hypothetical protein